MEGSHYHSRGGRETEGRWAPRKKDTDHTSHLDVRILADGRP
jgi:hypothetical protein